MMVLNNKQVKQFDENGYILLPQVLTAQQLSLLRQCADTAEEKAMNALKADAERKDFIYSVTFFTAYLNRLLHFHLHGGMTSLTMLGHPAIVGAGKQLCGEDCVATIDMMIYKHPENHAQIPWHQDLIYQSRDYRIATIGIYLDDAVQGNGALKVLPGTQDRQRDICDIIRNPQPSAIEIPAKAGDIIIHNPMMVHRSDPIAKGNKRRTLYYEFRPLQQVIDDPIWPTRIIQRRQQLFDMAQKYYLDQQLPDSDTLQSLYCDPLPFNSANICKEAV